MPRCAVPFVLALACLATAPVSAGAQQATTPPGASAAAAPLPGGGRGPRVQPDFPRYEPAIARDRRFETTAAAADKTTITITTLGLVLLIVLLLILIA